MQDSSNKKYVLFRRGADSGFFFGIYLAIMFLCMAHTLTVQALGFIAFIMVLAVPVITYKVLRRSFIGNPPVAEVSALWMQGIVMFACGSVILALIAYIFMRFLHPDFIVEQMQAAIDVYRSADVDGAAGVADMVQRVIDANLVPKPIEVAVEMIWVGVFSGSILSLLMALLAVMRIPLKKS